MMTHSTQLVLLNNIYKNQLSNELKYSNIIKLWNITIKIRKVGNKIKGDLVINYEYKLKVVQFDNYIDYNAFKKMEKNINKGFEEEQSNITVAIRIRPLNAKEINSGDNDIIRVQDNLILVLDPLDIQIQQKKVTDVLHRSKEQRYAFDKIYRNHPSETIYIQTVQPLIKTVLNGFNATVFAYGPTGTGKTYTMLGNQQTYGLNVLAIKDLFKSIENDMDNNYEIFITYVQIYNEMIRDLLVPASGYLQLRDDPERGVVIAGITEFKAESTEQVMNLLLIGNRRRTTQATNANLTSSRSHAVFQIMLNKVSRTKNTTIENIIGKLSLIDLAGSERGTVTENRGLRLMEGAKINRSLLALANCINALGDKNKKGFFVPYRDSKLTRLLKDSLGGSCKTVMIVNVSPSSSQFEQTINTLKYANRAKNIKTKALTNKKLVALHISQYKNIINDLRRQIDELKQRLSDKGVEESVDNRDRLPKIDNKLSKPPLPNINSSQGASCSCGHLDQKQEMRSIKEQIFENFNERIQLRRAMMQIQQQNAMNILQIKKKQGEISLIKKNQNWEETDGDAVKQITKLITTLKLSTNKNNLKKEITNLQIMQSMTNTKKIRDEIMRKIKTKQNRQVLEIIIKNHVLELQNIELEINLQIQERMISDMKQIITSQKQIINQNNIEGLNSNNMEEDLLLGEEDVLQLQQDFEDQNDEPGSQDDQIEPEIYRNFQFNKNKGVQRNKSAKKQLEAEKGRKKLQELNLKRNNKDNRDKTTQKNKPPSIDLAGLALGLKGMKMNPKKKR